MAAGANKDIATKLAEEVETPTIKNAPFTTKLSDAMKINIEMAKKLNIKVTQEHDPE